MGVVYSMLIRQTQRFNVENRAMRAIERKKPVHAPRHASASKYLDEIVEGTPEVREQLVRKDVKLDKYLKDVYVTSTGSMPEIVRNTSLLPQRRDAPADDEFGFWQPEDIPKGKASLGQILKFLAEHQINSETHSAQTIAKEYNLDEKSVALILEYYTPLNIYVPAKEKNTQSPFFGKRLLSLVGGDQSIDSDKDKKT